MAEDNPYGLLAEFDNPEALICAARRAREQGYREMDTFTPFPVDELNEVLALRDWRVLWLGLIGGIFGAFVALAMQAYVNFDYPINVGGRDQYAWPAFAIVTFELTILFAALFPAFGMLAFSGLPRLYHPVFNDARFARASKDRFFLCIMAKDPQFDCTKTAHFMEGLNARSIELVPE
jgi:hypothetical protein